LRWLTSEIDWLRHRNGPELTLAFALGTFQTCVLVLVLLVLMYLLGDLGKLLGGLSSAAGIGVFLLLWLNTLYCTLRALAAVGFEKLPRNPIEGMLVQGTKWGGIDGMLFLLVPLLPALVVASLYVLVYEGEFAASVAAFYGGALVLVIAAAVACFIGAQIGFVAASLQVPLLYAAQRVVGPAAPADEQSETPA
jgi:hypothetical protein